MLNAIEPAGKKTEIAVVRDQLEKMGPQFQAALPAHIPLERFERVVMTAIQNNMDLVNKCSRASLFNACVKAAQDGLLPDGREGAIVGYGTEAQWMPMIFGIRKKVRNSGEIADWDVQLVYENDAFEHELGTGKFVRHKRAMGPRGELVGGYSVANLKDGGVSIEIMSIHEIEAVRMQASRAKSDKSPWNIAAYYGEMCRKTVARRHSKMLPMSSDLDDLIRRDDDLYDMQGAAAEAQPRRRRLGAQLDQLAEPSGNVPAQEHERDAAAESDQESREAAAQPQQFESPEPPKDKPAKEAAPKESKAADKKPEPPKEPTTEREWTVYARAWIDAALAAGDDATLKDRWNSAAEKTLRNRCNVGSDTREAVFDHLTAARDQFAKKSAA